MAAALLAAPSCGDAGNPCTEDGEVLPIEVKAGNNSTRSLNDFMNKFSPSAAYKLIGGNVGKAGTKLTLPHYFVMFI